jgi:hypothetical protein
MLGPGPFVNLSSQILVYLQLGHGRSIHDFSKFSLTKLCFTHCKLLSIVLVSAATFQAHIWETPVFSYTVCILFSLSWYVIGTVCHSPSERALQLILCVCGQKKECVRFLIPVLLKAFLIISAVLLTPSSPQSVPWPRPLLPDLTTLLLLYSVYTRIGHKHQPNWLLYLLTTLHLMRWVWQLWALGKGGGVGLYLLKGYSAKSCSMLSWYLQYRYADSAYCRTCLPSKEWSS